MSTKQTIEIFSTKEKLPDVSLPFVLAAKSSGPNFEDGYWERAHPNHVSPATYSHWFCHPDTPPEPEPTAAEPPKGVDPDLMKRLGDMRILMQGVYRHRSMDNALAAISSLECVLNRIIDTLQGLAEKDANRTPAAGNLGPGQRVKLKGTNRTGIIAEKTSGGWHTVKWEDELPPPHVCDCYRDWELEPV